MYIASVCRPRRSPHFRCLCLLLTLCFVWSFAVAPCAIAAGAAGKTPTRPAPRPPRRFSSPAERLANTPYAAPARPWAAVAPPQASASRRLPDPAASITGPSPVTLLDDVGRPARPVPPAEAAAWIGELHAGPPPSRAATLHLWLGEWALSRNQQPGAAQTRFRLAQRMAHRAAANPTDRPQAGRLYGLAAYDGALALFYAGAYQDAAAAFHRLLLPRMRLSGYDARTCALWWRHASACAGYHAQRSALGIPEPPRLDPLCGVAALAAGLRPLGLPAGRKALLAACRVTGEGDSLADLGAGARRLGASLHVVTADDTGLQALPKPLIAHVERDHFIAVIGAGAKGVSYLCSDCGPWPGGRVDLTWRQWHALDADAYGVVARPGGAWDGALDGLRSPPRVGAGVRVATAGRLDGLGANRTLAAFSLASRLRGHVFRGVTGGQYVQCDRQYDSLICPPGIICCPEDGGGPGNQAGGPGDPGPSPIRPIGPPGLLPATAAGASAGDPVNLATGAEDYAPAPDLTVYNPHGPSVVWARSYDSLRHADQYSERDFGYEWASSYQMYVDVVQPTAPGPPQPNYVYQCYVVLPGGSRLGFHSPAPTAANPVLHCAMAPGVPYLVDWRYDSGSTPGSTHFVVTSEDRTRWTTGQGTLNTTYGLAPLYFQPVTIADRNGNALSLTYASYQGYTDLLVPLLTGIADAATGAVLLTINRATSNDGSINGQITSVSDCYGRSVYYHESKYGYIAGGSGAAWSEVDQVSQVVPTNTASALTQYRRYAYDYNPCGVGDGPAFLSRITVPSPTGSGTQAASINYDTSTHLVSSLVDAGGNRRLYNFNAGDANHTSVTVQDASGHTAYGYTAGYNPDMSATSRTDGAGNPTYTVNAFDPSDPYRPSSATDGNGRTTLETWDGYGHLLTETPPSNGARTPAATTYTYQYPDADHPNVFPLGELTQVQEGNKSPTCYTYYEPSGLVASVYAPLPGSPGTVNPTPTTYTYDLTTYDGSGNVTYQGLGNLLSVTTPGNNATVVGGTDRGITTTFNYITDGGYTRSAAIGQPLTVTDNLGVVPGQTGKVTHLRYDSRGNCLSVTDALGNKTDFTYNVADQRLQTTFPATGQQGPGRSSSLSTYLYPDGPLTGTALYDEGGSGVPFRQVNHTYGPEGEALGVSGSAEPVTYTYDPQYRLSTLTDGGSHTTHYYYKRQGYLDAVTYPGYGGPAPAYNAADDGYDNVTGPDSLRFPSYDNNGNLLTRVDGNGVTTTYTHSADPESLLTLTHYAYLQGYAETQIADVSLSYDGYGRRSGMTDGTGSQSYTYDDGGSLLTHTTAYTDLPAATLTYAYWPDGSRRTMTTPAGGFSYSYDADERMTGLSNPSGEASSWQYLDNGWLWKRALADGAITAHAYNALGQTTDLLTKNGGGATLSDFGGQTYDGAGDRTALTASLPAAPSAYSGQTAYGYDAGQMGNAARSQLTGEQSTRGGGYTSAFAYDGGIATGPGNPTTFGGAARSFNADNQDSANTYDGDGSPTTYQGQALSFDPEARLTETPSYSQIGGGTETEGMGYTGDGLRAWKSVAQESGGPIIDPGGPVGGPVRPGGGPQGTGGGQTNGTLITTTTTYFLYDGDEPVCEIDGDGGVTAVNTFGTDGLVSRHTGGGSVFYTFDPSGNTAQRLSSGGGVLSSDRYGGFGGLQATTGGGDVFGSCGQWGGYTDQETGLVLMTHRFYDPATGRFLTRDPIGYDGGINMYGYCTNNPINKSDPSGYMSARDQCIRDAKDRLVAELAVIFVAGMVCGFTCIKLPPPFEGVCLGVCAAAAAIALGLAFGIYIGDIRDCPPDPPKSCPSGPKPPNRPRQSSPIHPGFPIPLIDGRNEAAT